MYDTISNNLHRSQSQVIPFISPADMQKFTKNQFRRRGVRFAVAANGTTITPIQMPGDAKMFIGVCVYDPTGDAGNNLTLRINSDVRVENVSHTFLTRVFGFRTDGAGLNIPQTTAYDGEFFPVPYPLNGNDDLVLSYAALTAGTIDVELVFI